MFLQLDAESAFPIVASAEILFPRRLQLPCPIFLSNELPTATVLQPEAAPQTSIAAHSHPASGANALSAFSGGNDSPSHGKGPAQELRNCETGPRSARSWHRVPENGDCHRGSGTSEKPRPLLISHGHSYIADAFAQCDQDKKVGQPHLHDAGYQCQGIPPHG